MKYHLDLSLFSFSVFLSLFFSLLSPQNLLTLVSYSNFCIPTPLPPNSPSERTQICLFSFQQPGDVYCIVCQLCSVHPPLDSSDNSFSPVDVSLLDNKNTLQKPFSALFPPYIVPWSSLSSFDLFSVPTLSYWGSLRQPEAQSEQFVLFFFYFPSGCSSNSCFMKACLLLTPKMNHVQFFWLVLSVWICSLRSKDLFFLFCFFSGLTFNNLCSDVLKLVSLQSPQSAFPTKPLPMSCYNKYAGREQKHFEV